MAVTTGPTHTRPEPPGLRALLDLVSSLHPEADLDKLRGAYFFADDAHMGQSRMGGEPFIGHPLEVARIVTELRMDEESVIAALLHDTIEDTAVTAEQIAAQFGPGVLSLVEGVTKLKLNVALDATDRQRAAAETTRAAETLRKMLLAMAQDVRVMVIKLADRLHNMRTLDALPPVKRTRVANETLDVYAPLSARLGIWQVKWQLEDLAFKHLHPTEYRDIEERVAKTRIQRELELEEAIRLFRQRLDDRGLTHAKISGRPKHLYSIFNKVVKQGVPFEEVYDLLAVRVIVAEPQECYLALGLAHELWLPMPGLFTDHIAMPKPNGYQSLHTKVIGPGGDPLEVQIRTERMHVIAEFGVAAHWTYKEGSERPSADHELTDLRRQLFDWSSDSQTSSDFLRAVSTDLFSEQVFVFTPKGDVLDLPKDSTPIDFAFRVHSNLGLVTVGSKVNGVMVPLSTKLKNGEVVELITRRDAQPSLDWLEYAKSQHARSKIRAYFRRRNKTENAVRGKDALERHLKSHGLDPRQFLGDDKMNQVAAKLRNCENAQDVFARVGEGLATVQSVVDRLRGIVQEQQGKDVFRTEKSRATETTVLQGIDNVTRRRARCCMPIPDDDVVGYVTRGRGIMIHRRLCPNAIRLMELEPERILALRWPPDGGRFGVDLKVVTVNRQGLLADISTIFGEAKTNVAAAKIKTLPNNTAEIDVTIEVGDLAQLQAVMNKIGNFTDVISILRLFGRSASK